MKEAIERMLDHTPLCWACMYLRPCEVYDHMMTKLIYGRRTGEIK